MQYAGLFSFVTALKIGARLWRDVLARKPEKPCKYDDGAHCQAQWAFFMVLTHQMKCVKPSAEGLFYPSTRARENPYYPIYVKTTLYIMSCWIIGLWKCGVSFIKDLFSLTTAVQTGSFWYLPVFSLDNGRQNMRCNSPRFRKAFPGC